MKISLKNTSKISFNLPWLAIAFILIMIPFSGLNAQDEDYEDPTEVFWGDDEEEDDSYEDDEFYDDDTSDYYEDDEFYDDDTSDYYEDEDFDESDSEFEEEGDLSETELADKANSIGYSLNISGSSPSFVNHDMNSYNNSPQINFRLSVEFPLLMQMMGVRFRFGVEIGNFGFENYLPIGGKISGLTAMGLLAFPAGPGKIILAAGLIENRFGFSAESSYGFSIGNTLELRAGVRSTTAWNVIDDKSNDLGTVSWVDGLIMLGFNL